MSKAGIFDKFIFWVTKKSFLLSYGFGSAYLELVCRNLDVYKIRALSNYETKEIAIDLKKTTLYRGDENLDSPKLSERELLEALTCILKNQYGFKDISVKDLPDPYDYVDDLQV